MVYNAKSERLGLFIMLTAILLMNIIGEYHDGIVKYLIPLFLVIIVGFIDFSFKIEDGYLIYQILFLNRTFYKKDIFPDQIVRMKFCRVRWTTKCTIIEIQKGPNIRIVDFRPTTIFTDLVDFANVHHITIFKTKDYKIIDK
ncbi:hypothetical protein ACNQFZ_00245 [Schinkia sp. CFF1]